MQIHNVHFHFGNAIGAAALAALMGFDKDSAAPTAPAPAKDTLPRIGEAWPGIDGVYAGVSRGENGEPDAHLVLLNALPEKNLSWQAAADWAQGLGDGARLPTRFESALLYAHLQDKLDTEKWHWTGTQYSGSNAWGQDFGNGSQVTNGKKYEARARAVRRLIL